jgi:CelD/BcsL family acetyltransferase involved in cellulose biosynthesis
VLSFDTCSSAAGDTVLCLTKHDALEFVRQRLDLFEVAGKLNPFSCGEWAQHFLGDVAEDDWTIVIPEDRTDGESLMLLYRAPPSVHQCSGLTNYYASLYSPLISTAEDRSAATSALVKQLKGMRPRCAVINFQPLDGDSPDTQALRQALARNGWFVRPYFCFGNWYLPCAGLSFSDYMRSRGSQIHSTWTRKSKKFSRSPETRLEIVTESAAADAAVDAFEKVYAKSWKQAEPYPNFVRGWARICAQKGWLRLGIAWAGEVPIAAQFWFTMHGHAYIFKLAYDEAYSNWSAGTVLTAAMFEYSLDRDRVIEIDYLTGDDAYKQSWMTQRRERIGLIACNLGTPRGLLIATREWAGRIRSDWQSRRNSPPAP